MRASVVCALVSSITIVVFATCPALATGAPAPPIAPRSRPYVSALPRQGRELASLPGSPLAVSEPNNPELDYCYPAYGNSLGTCLSDVAGTSADDEWAVGTYMTVTAKAPNTLVEHWDGNRWTQLASPDPGSLQNDLLGVSELSSNDVWAVGFFSNLGGNGNLITLIEHWDGSSWSQVPSPSPGTLGASLEAVTAVTPTDAWAVGSFEDEMGYQSLIEHWNGSAWTVVSSPLGGGLVGVSADSSSDAWAVGGSGGIEHWNGTSWVVVQSSSEDLSLSDVAAVTPTDAWAVGSACRPGEPTACQTFIEEWDGTDWAKVPSPSPGHNGGFYSVSADSVGDVWAVGWYVGGRHGELYDSLIAQWNGSSWEQVPSPNPGTYDNELYGVSGTSSQDAWAVGLVGFPGTEDLTSPLAEHWNGSEWSAYPMSVPRGMAQRSLLAVSAEPTEDAWAAGWFGAPSGDRAILDRWSGAVWQNSLDRGGSMNAVSADSPTDAWALGETASGSELYEHWNGAQWQRESGPSDLGLVAVSADSPTDAWAVGYTYKGPSDTAVSSIAHWDGVSWAQVPSPNPGGQGGTWLYAVSAVSPTDVWAVGYTCYNCNSQTLVLHWDGTGWSEVPSPSPGDASELLGVSADSTSDAWAVGVEYETGSALIEHWNGSTWSVIPAPNLANYNELYAVSADSPTDAWAVGTVGTFPCCARSGVGDSQNERTLTEHWDGTSWAQIASPNPGALENAYTVLYGVSAASSMQVWAVGDTTYLPSNGSRGFILLWNGTDWVACHSDGSC